MHVSEGSAVTVIVALIGYAGLVTVEWLRQRGQLRRERGQARSVISRQLARSIGQRAETQRWRRRALRAESREQRRRIATRARTRGRRT
jgi:hypothetical protein